MDSDTIPLYLLAAALVLIVIVIVVMAVKGNTPVTTVVASICLIGATICAGAAAAVDLTDDTPTWDERMETKYGIEFYVDDHQPRDEPGNWKIDGEWRTCYSPDFAFKKDDNTLVCQPVTPESAYEELDAS